MHLTYGLVTVKRYACTLLYIAPGQTLKNAVVEVGTDGVPVRWYALCGEQPFTEWLGGVMVFLPVGVIPPEHGVEDFPLWLETVFREAGDGAPCHLWQICGLSAGECCLPPAAFFRRLQGWE